MGFPLLIAPGYALGGAKAVELFLAAIAALAMALAYRLALRVAPDPWALGAARGRGAQPAAPRLRQRGLSRARRGAPRSRAPRCWRCGSTSACRGGTRSPCFVLLGALPWLGTKFVPAGVVIGAFAARSIWRARRRTLAVGAVELSLFSVALYVAHQRGDLRRAHARTPPTCRARPPPTRASRAGYLERAYRLVALFLDRDYGLLRWAPVFALAFAGLWWLWRSRRDRLARAVPDVRAIELAAGLCAAALGAQLLVAAFLRAHDVRLLVPAAAPAGRRCRWRSRSWRGRCATCRASGIALAALTLAASAWLYADVRWGDGSLAADRPDAPFGPLTELLPLFEPGGGWPFWLAGAIGVALVRWSCARRARRATRARRPGATRARYSG